MLKKSLYLSWAAALVVALVFAGCPAEIEYRDVPGPEVQVEVPVPGDTEYVDRPVPGDTVYVDVPGDTVYVDVPGDTVYVDVPGPDVPGPEIPVPYYVVADRTAANETELRAALLEPEADVKVVAVTAAITLTSSALEIPADKALWLYAKLDGQPIEVKGKVIVAYNGILAATASVPVTVTGGIEVQQTGHLEADTAAAVIDGEGTTALGTPKVTIDGYGAKLIYTAPVTTPASVQTAYNSYITKGLLDVQGLKLSELAAIANPADANIKKLVAVAGVNETEATLTVPVNAVLTAYGSDPLTTATTLDVEGILDTGTTNPVLANLTTLTVDGELKTLSALPKVTGDVALNGSLVAPNVTFAGLTNLVVKKELVLANATFAALTTLEIEGGASLKADVATFAKLTSLTMAPGAEFTAPAGLFTLLNPAGGLVVEGTLTAGASGAIFPALTRLTVNGTLKASGSATTAFAKVTDLTVSGTFETNAATALAALKTLQVNSAGSFTASGGTTTLAAITTLTVDGGLTAGYATFAGVTTATLNSAIAAPSATWAKVATLVLNAPLNAPLGTFAAITNVTGSGSLVAGTVVATGGGKAKILLDSSLTSVSLKPSAAIAVDITIAQGKTRTFATGSTFNPTGSITVESGGTLNIDYDSAALASAANKTITVNGNLNFNGGSAAPGPITVNTGGKVAFNGVTPVPAGNITVNGGGLAFNTASAAPLGNITVDGEMTIGEDADVTIAQGKTLAVNGTLKATDLEIRGVTYAVPNETGAKLVIKGDINGSTLAAIVVTDALTGTFDVTANGYIKDTTPKKSWTLDGGNSGGSLAYTGTAGINFITLGAGSIKSAASNGTTFVAAKVTDPKASYVALDGTVSIVAHRYTGIGSTIGLTLTGIAIDVTNGGSIVVESNGVLNLANPSSATTLIAGGVITTASSSVAFTDSPKGLAIGGRVPLIGNLTKIANNGNLAGLNAGIGKIGGTSQIIIDEGDLFGPVTNGVIAVTHN